MRTREELIDMSDRLNDNVREHGWDASVDAAHRALEWALGAEWPDLPRFMTRPDDERRKEWLARGGDPAEWPDRPATDRSEPGA